MMKFFNFKTSQKKKKNETLIIEEINNKIGVKIHGINNLNEITTTQIDTIKKSIANYQIVVISGGQKLTEEEQILFTKKLGEMKDPPIYVIPPGEFNNKKYSEKTIKKASLFWHSENSYNGRSAYLNVLQMIETPINGVETYFTSLINLYNSLSEELKEKWKNYTISYQNNVSHSLFWKHPYNGKEAVYFDIGFVTKVKDDCAAEEELSIKKTNEVFDYINDKLNEEKSFFVHKWKKGDIIILDNYAIAKRINFIIEDEKWTLLSTTTEGIYF